MTSENQLLTHYIVASFNKYYLAQQIRMGMDNQRHGPANLDPGMRADTNCVGFVGPRDGLDGRGKSRPHRDSIPGMSNP